MQIRTRLTFQFFVSVALMIFFCFLSIYLILQSKRKKEFFSRLDVKIQNMSLLYANPRTLPYLLDFERAKVDTVFRPAVQIFDTMGRQIFNNQLKDTIVIDDKRLQKILKSGVTQFMVGRNEYLARSFHQNGKAFVIVSGTYDLSSDIRNNFLLKLLIWLYSCSVLLVAIVGWVFSQRAIMPLAKVMREVNDLPLDSLDARIGAPNENDEIGQLTAAFNAMLDKLQHTLNIQKTFISAVSHEIKNPLTSITTQLQVLQMQERHIDEYKYTIDSVLEDIDFLNKTANDLIEFAQISYETNAAIKLVPLRIDELIWECKDYYQKIHKDCSIQLSFGRLPDNHDELLFQLNQALIKVAILNLIDNGCKFSDDRKVNITLALSIEGAKLIFSNQGRGISIEDQQSIFQPFFRADKASKTKGHGLGLAITKRIVEIHKGEISVDSTDQLGTHFILRLPRKF